MTPAGREQEDHARQQAAPHTRYVPPTSCAWPDFERTREWKQGRAIAAADAFALANPVVCLDCGAGNHARCIATEPCGCCGERRAA